VGASVQAQTAVLSPGLIARVTAIKLEETMQVKNEEAQDNNESNSHRHNLLIIVSCPPSVVFRLIGSHFSFSYDVSFLYA